MNALSVPEGIRVHETSLAGRPALRVSPDAAADPEPCSTSTAGRT